MRYITDLNKEIIEALEQIIKNEARYKSRYRAQAILLSNQRKTVNELAEIFGVEIRTIYRWFDRFKEEEIEGLYEKKGRGRKPKLKKEEDEEKIQKYIKKTSI